MHQLSTHKIVLPWSYLISKERISNNGKDACMNLYTALYTIPLYLNIEIFSAIFNFQSKS